MYAVVRAVGCGVTVKPLLTVVFKLSGVLTVCKVSISGRRMLSFTTSYVCAWFVVIYFLPLIVPS